MARKTYLQSSLKNGLLMRWPEQCFPLKFYIAPFHWYNKTDRDKVLYQRLVVDALNVWQKVANGKVRFQIVNQLNDSQINLEWKRVDRKSLGYCHYNYDQASRLYSAEVQIGISDGIIHKQYMDENEVFHTILHEIGHAIGLGHSDVSGDIMYVPHQYGAVQLTARDILTLQWLYTFPAGMSPNDISKAYGLGFSDVDETVEYLIDNKPKSEFEKMMNSLPKQNKDLLQEQSNLAEIKKYYMSLQNIGLPQDIKNKFKEK